MLSRAGPIFGARAGALGAAGGRRDKQLKRRLHDDSSDAAASDRDLDSCTHWHQRRQEAERDPALREAIAAELRRALDPQVAPPIRATLFVIGEARHVLLVVIHHVATDGWSMGILQRELTALYEAFHTGQSSPLPALSARIA